MTNCDFTIFLISLGYNVLYGKYCNIATDISIGNNVLLASIVCIVSRHDQLFNDPITTLQQC